MRRSSRFAVFALTAALVTAPAVRAADVDPLLPAETEQVVYINVKQLLDSDLFNTFAKKQLEEMLKQGEVQQLLGKIGLDPLKDISSVTLGGWGSDPSDMKLVGVVRGSFDGAKLLKTAEEVAKAAGDKMSIVEEGDFKLVKVIGDGDKPFFASVADGKTLVVGTDKKVVAGSLTAHKKGAKPALSKDLTALMLKQDAKASLYLCGTTGGKLDALPNIPDLGQVKGADLKKQLGSVNDISVTLRVGKDVTLDMTAGMKDETAAAGFGGNLEQLLPLAKAALPFAAAQQPQLKPLADDVAGSLKTKVAKSDVTVSLKLSGTAIGKLAGGDK